MQTSSVAGLSLTLHTDEAVKPWRLLPDSVVTTLTDEPSRDIPLRNAALSTGWAGCSNLCMGLGGQFFTDDLGTGGQGMELAAGNVPGQGRHAAIGAGAQQVGIDELKGLA